MPSFEWEALTPSGERIKGKLEAVGKEEVIRYLKEKGYLPVRIKDATPFQKRFNFWSRVGLVDKLMFTRYLGTMIAAGLPLPQALATLQEQTRNSKLKNAIEVIKSQIEKGKSLSESFSSFPDIFPYLYVSMVKVGEETGKLDEVLERLADHLEKSHDLRGKIVSALLYPAIVLGIVAIMLPLMILFLVPRMAETFKELEVDIPPLTMFLLDVNDFLRTYWYLIIAMILFSFFGFYFLWKSARFKETLSLIGLKLPVFSNLVRMSNTAMIARTLATLIAAGVPLLETLNIMVDTISNQRYRKSLLVAQDKVQKGYSLHQSLSEFSDIYPPVFLSLLRVGEETGQTARIAEQLAIFFEKETERATQNLASILPPIVMIFVGLIVGVFIFTVLQPMFSVAQGFRT